MEAARPAAIEAYYRDGRQRQQPENIAVNIAIIEKSLHQTLPTLYVLKKDIWDAELSTSKPFGNANEHPLLVLGPVMSLDRFYKRIYLPDGILVTYNHLLVFAPRRLHSDSNITLNAMQTLIYALRCQPIRPMQSADPTKKRLHKVRIDQSSPNFSSQALKHPPLRQYDSAWISVEHWLCEIQT